MTRSRPRSVAVLMAILTVALVGATSPWPTASADVSAPRTYQGASYGDSLDVPPTRYENQSKLWFHDGAWWASMFNPADATAGIFELLPDHTWRPTGTVINSSPADLGDALLVGEVLYVVSRDTAETLQLRRLLFDAVTRQFVPSTTDPVIITGRGGLAGATIAKDSTGRLWITFAASSAIFVAHSDDDGLTWAQPFVPAVPGGAVVSPNEVSSIVAFAGTIGLMWSDQAKDSFYFAVHRDGDPDDQWTRETALTGSGLSDNHISVKAVNSGTYNIVAAVKSSQGDAGEAGDAPLILVLARDSAGVWTSIPAASLEDKNDSPLVQIDETNNVVYLFSEGPGGLIYAKSSPLTQIAFEPGRGDAFVIGGRSRPAEATGSKHPVTERTGLVVLASGVADDRYSHAELPILMPESTLPTAADGQDTEPPSMPENVVASVTPSGSVTISWAPANDGDRWFPAADSVPVQGYTVHRDGTELGTTDQTSYGDVPPASSSNYEYSVRAFDRAGNQSVPATVNVAVPQAAASSIGPSTWLLAATGIVAIFIATVLTLRWRRGRY